MVEWERRQAASNTRIVGGSSAVGTTSLVATGVAPHLLSLLISRSVVVARRLSVLLGRLLLRLTKRRRDCRWHAVLIRVSTNRLLRGYARGYGSATGGPRPNIEVLKLQIHLVIRIDGRGLRDTRYARHAGRARSRGRVLRLWVMSSSAGH